MPNFTANYNLTKPLATELYDVAVTDSNADAIDSAIKARADAITALDTRVTALEAVPTEFTNKITASAGWTVNTQTMYKIGRIIFVHFQFTRTGATISGPSDGNIVNSGMGVIDVGYRPAGTGRATWATSTTGMGMGGYVGENGVIAVSWIMAGQTIATNEVVTGSATYLQGN